MDALTWVGWTGSGIQWVALVGLVIALFRAWRQGDWSAIPRIVKDIISSLFGAAATEDEVSAYISPEIVELLDGDEPWAAYRCLTECVRRHHAPDSQ